MTFRSQQRVMLLAAGALLLVTFAMALPPLIGISEVGGAGERSLYEAMVTLLLSTFGFVVFRKISRESWLRSRHMASTVQSSTGGLIRSRILGPFLRRWLHVDQFGNDRDA